MEKPIKITAVCGWAIPPAWFEVLVSGYFPGTEVQAVYPSEPADSQEAQVLLKNPAHLVIGYSLGTLWLLYHRHHIPRTARKSLLAPILSFIKEDKMGGKTPAGQLKYLLRMLARNAKDNSPLYDFFSRSGLSLGKEFYAGIPERPILIKGLEFLEEVRVAGEATKGFSAFLGDSDPMLDDIELKERIPHLQIIRGAGHAPQDLLRSLADGLVFE